MVKRYWHNGQYFVESRPGALAKCDDPEAARSALLAYERSSLPAPENKLQQELGGLKVMTKSAQATTEDIEMQIRMYARELTKYPADVALHVIRTQAGMEKWWPAWAELKERLDLYGGKRRERREQLRDLVRLTDELA